MDVQCEQCKTEYELDDSGVSAAEVTVQCTTCGHVFRIQRSAAAMPPEQGAHSVAPTEVGQRRHREWKVRQPGGNFITFRELTTLQKWIVERRVSRDDEISLTGETWKRLGSIPDLESFFQVVEEAQRAAPLEPVAQASTPSVIIDDLTLGAETRSASTEHLASDERLPRKVPESLTIDEAEMLDDDFAEPTRRPWTWMLLLLMAVGAGASLYYALGTRRIKPMPPPPRPEPESHSPAIAKQPTKPLGMEEPKAPSRLGVGAADAQVEGAQASALDAGVIGSSATSDSGSPIATEAVENITDEPLPARQTTRFEPAHNFDWYMNQGKRLRERRQPLSALGAYGRAAKLRPDRAEPIAGKGYALLDLGHHAQAEASFQEALKVNPNYGAALIGLAEAYRSGHRIDKAIQFYQRYLEVFPDGPDAPVARSEVQRLRQQ